MDFVRNVYTSLVSRHIAFLLHRGLTHRQAVSHTSSALSVAMGMNIGTVVVLFGWKPRSRFDLVTMIISFLVLSVLDRMNDRLILRWAGGHWEREPQRWPSFHMLLYVFGSMALMMVVMYLMLWPR
jgi:hypothetical protein